MCAFRSIISSIKSKSNYCPVRILVNDYAGHPFQVQLSRSLAGRGYRVLHTYCSSVLTPKGDLTKNNSDPDNFAIKAIKLDDEFDRYGLFTRWKQEKELGEKLVNVAVEFSPDIVISANTPLRAQAQLLRFCEETKKKFIFWVQDSLGIGIGKALSKKSKILGYIVGQCLQRYECNMLNRSDQVVVITDDFLHYIPNTIIQQGRVHVIENWAPLDEVHIVPKSNPWSIEHHLDDKICLLYSGTLGMKHNPDLILQTAVQFTERPDVTVVVVSEGLGAEYLKRCKSEQGLDNLVILDFQPYEVLPSVLGTADVLLAILEPDAGEFAVPSKVLTYLCAKKPLLLAVPKENLAARIVELNGAGIVVPPDDMSGFINAAIKLVNEPDLRSKYAVNARQYAERTFDIDSIASRFINLF